MSQLHKKKALFTVFDLSDRSSFQKLAEFLTTAKTYQIRTKLLIGNKAGSLNFLRQLMQDALQKSTSRKTWEQPNGTVVQGPLSWKQLHHLATKGLFCLVAIFTVLIKAEA